MWKGGIMVLGWGWIKREILVISIDKVFANELSSHCQKIGTVVVSCKINII